MYEGCEDKSEERMILSTCVYEPEGAICYSDVHGTDLICKGQKVPLNSPQEQQFEKCQ